MIKELKDWALQLGEVTEAPHRFDGTKFRVQNREFMHNHGPRHLDIRLSKEDQERMLKHVRPNHTSSRPKPDGSHIPYGPMTILRQPRN